MADKTSTVGNVQYLAQDLFIFYLHKVMPFVGIQEGILSGKHSRIRKLSRMI